MGFDPISFLMGKAAGGGGGGGGGGGDAWTLIGSAEYAVSTTSTSVTSVGTIDLDADALTEEDMIVVFVFDKVKKRNGYFYGSVTFGMTCYDGYNIIAQPNLSPRAIYVDNYNNYAIVNGGYGVYADQYKPANKTIGISARYSSNNSKTIDGTYSVKVYKLTPPFTMYE